MHVQLILHGFLLWHLVRRPSRRQHHSMSGFTQGGAPPLHHNFTSMILLFLPPHFLSLSTLRTFGLTVPLPGTPDCSYNKLLVTSGCQFKLSWPHQKSSRTSTTTQLKSFFQADLLIWENPLLTFPYLQPTQFVSSLFKHTGLLRFRTKEMVWSSPTSSGPLSEFLLVVLLNFSWDLLPSLSL